MVKKKVEGKLLRFLDWTLSADITPLAYLVVIYTGLFAGGFLFFPDSLGTRSTVLYQIGMPGGITLWSFMLFGSCLWVLIAMHVKNIFLLSISSMIGFLALWAAAITYAQGARWLQFAMAGTMALMFGYFFIAGSVGRLWNYTPDNNDSKE